MVTVIVVSSLSAYVASCIADNRRRAGRTAPLSCIADWYPRFCPTYCSCWGVLVHEIPPPLPLPFSYPPRQPTLRYPPYAAFQLHNQNLMEHHETRMSAAESARRNIRTDITLCSVINTVTYSAASACSSISNQYSDPSTIFLPSLHFVEEKSTRQNRRWDIIFLTFLNISGRAWNSWEFFTRHIFLRKICNHAR